MRRSVVIIGLVGLQLVLVSEALLSISRLAAVDTSTLDLVWSVIDSNHTSCCNVTWQPADPGSHVNISDTSYSATIQGLTAGRSYTVRVCAVSSDNIADCSTNTSNNTYPSAPTTLTLLERGTFGFTLHWTQDGVISNITVLATSADSSQDKPADIPDLINHIISVGGLVSGDLYDTTLTAHSGQLSNTSTVHQFRTMPREPDSVDCQLSNDTALSVLVYPPAYYAYQLDQYVLQYSDTDQCHGAGSLEHIVSASVNTTALITLTSLQPATSYQLCVYSSSGGVRSEMSTNITCETTDVMSSSAVSPQSTAETSRQASDQSTTDSLSTSDNPLTSDQSIQVQSTPVLPPTAAVSIDAVSIVRSEPTSGQISSTTNITRLETSTDDVITSTLHYATSTEHLLSPIATNSDVTINTAQEIGSTQHRMTSSATRDVTFSTRMTSSGHTSSPQLTDTSVVTSQPLETTSQPAVEVTSSMAWIAGAVLGGVAVAGAASVGVYAAVVHSLSMSYSLAGVSQSALSNSALYAPRYSYYYPSIDDVITPTSVATGNGHVITGV